MTQVKFIFMTVLSLLMVFLVSFPSTTFCGKITSFKEAAFRVYSRCKYAMHLCVWQAKNRTFKVNTFTIKKKVSS